jgi:glycosyltransferase involved in cell wall biosynthesis
MTTSNDKIEPDVNELRIVFDHQIFILQEYGGISRYICNLAKELCYMPGVKVNIAAPLHFNKNLENLKNVSASRFIVPNTGVKFLRPIQFLSKHLSRKIIKKFKPKILHETYYSNENFITESAKRVITVYDLIHERYPEFFERSHLTTGPKRNAVQRADHVICISESTRRDVIEYLNIKHEKTSVIYLGIDDNFLQSNFLSKSKIIKKRPYLLYVGSRGSYKNFSNFLKAFCNSKKIKSDFDLICFGGGRLSNDEIAFSKKLGIEENQLIQVSGSDLILANLYKEAYALVYPSLYEGFGMPPLEAMALGCPVICSNTSSLPEVVGNAAETFDPLDNESIKLSMEKVLYSTQYRLRLIDLGLGRSRMFSWNKCASETELIYRKLI